MALLILKLGAVQASMAQTLRNDTSFFFESIDLAAYPYASISSTPPPCAVALQQCNPDFHATLLDSAGHQRLKNKALRLSRTMQDQGAAQIFYEELLSALGYKGNRAPFRTLAHRLPVQRLRDLSCGDPTHACALLLGVSGLLPRNTAQHWDAQTRSFTRALWDHWWKHNTEWENRCMQPEQWKRDGIRPLNHPIRRMAAAAALLTSTPNIESQLASLDTDKPRLWLKSCRAILGKNATSEYWMRRLSLGGPPQDKDTALLGKGRISAILSNVLIPFLAASGIPTDKLLAALPAEQESSIIRQAAFSLLGRDHNPSLYGCAVKQQGLIQIFYDFCLNNRSDCKTCSLPEAIREHSSK